MKKKRIAALLALFILGGAFSKIHLDRHLKTRKDFEIRFLPSPRVANILAFGFKPALADVYWIEAINYFGEQLMNKKRTYKYLKSYTDLILSLDPLFGIFYDWAGTAFLYNGLPITRENLIQSTAYINYGIEKFNEVHRYDRNTIVKGAFNYAIETTNRAPSIPYFELAGRSFSDQRNMLIVGASYALIEKNPILSSQLKLEYFGHIAFEAQKKEELKYAILILSSSRTNVQAIDFVKALRIKMESDEDIRKIVQRRFDDEPLLLHQVKTENSLPPDPRVENVLNIDFSRTWMPPDMLALFSL